MADESIALQFILDADKANLSLGELEQGYDALKEQIKKTDRSTAEGKAAFKELSTQLAETGREVKNIELSFEALDNEQVASELGSVAGAVGDVTASMVLLGGENETMEQMAASIEKAMAISMGFKGAIEGVSSGMKLYNNLLKRNTALQELQSKLTKVGIALQKALNFVMKQNPIMLIVAGITALAGAYALLSKEVDVAVETQKAYNEASDEAEKAVVKEKRSLDKLVETAKNDNLSKSQRMKAIEELNKLSPEYLGNISIETINTEEATAAIDGYVDSLNKKARAQALENQLLQAHNDLIDLERQQQEGSLTGLNKLVSFTQAAGVAQENQNQQNAEAVRIQKEKIQGLTDLINAEEEAIESHNLLNAARGIGITNVEELEKQAEEGRKERRENRKRDRSEDVEIERIDIENDLTLKTDEIARDLIHIEGLKSNREILRDVKAQHHAKTLEEIELEKAARKEAILENLDATKGLVDALGSISDAAFARDMKAAGNNEAAKEKARKKQFEREKKLQIAMAAINGAQAMVSILAQYPKFDGGFAMFAAMATAAVTTAATIAKIKATKYQGGGAGTVDTPSGGADRGAGGAAAGSGGAQIDAVSNTSTILGDQKVFVTETDITETQNNVNVIEQSATF